MTEESDGSPLDPTPPETERDQTVPRWKKVVMVVGGGVVVAAGAVLATLASTHKSAVRENEKAYSNGWRDGEAALQDEYDDVGYGGYCEGCYVLEGGMDYCPECHRVA